MSSPAPRTGRSAGVTQREFQSLRSEIINRFEDLTKQIQNMLPREIYEVRQRQVTDDLDDMRARIAKLETTNIDLNTQLLSVKQSTPQQIAKSTADVRYETLNRMWELATRVGFMAAGALFTFLAYYLGTHH